MTAVISGVNDKTVTWSADGGTIVGTNPCVVNEPCTVALYTTTPGTYHLTATSNANNSVRATSTITITGSPTPVTTHPRLGGITVSMLPGLRAKAVSTNPMYQQGLYNTATGTYYFASDNAIWSWSCNGGTGMPSSDQTQAYLEVHAYLYAFLSLVDPADPTYKWGCYSHDIIVYMMNYWMNPVNFVTAVYGSNDPNIAPGASGWTDAQQGLTGNHGADSTEYFTLTPDWLMAGGYLSSSDLTLTRKFFALAASQMISMNFNGTEAAVGNYNSSAQFNTGSLWDYGAQRKMGNNYTHSKIMYLTAAALTFNDNTTDDPATPNTCSATRYVVCPDGTAGSLHAYLTYLTGGMLYKDWANVEDPNVSWQAYQAAYGNLPTQPMCNDAESFTTSIPSVPCFGSGRDGESVEGSWYQYSMYRLQLAMLSIYTAGYLDPMVYGPQMSLATSSWWDLKANSDLEFLTYSYYTPQPRWGFFSTGDTLYLFRQPSDFNTEAWEMVSDSLTGRTDRTAKLEWPLLYTSAGGLSSFYANLGNALANDNAIPLFTALPSGDPTAAPPADPRSALPTDLYSGNNQHIMVRSGWVNNGPVSPSWSGSSAQTVFSSYCQNSRIDHEHSTCGSFDVLSNGEFITKQRTVFNNYNMMLAAAEFSNEAGYLANPAQTACTNAGSCWAWQAWQGYDQLGGGQGWHGYQAGSATLNHSELPGYVGFDVDTTGLYNGSAAPGVGWGSINGVTAASRSLVYLRGSNQVVTYDRGASTGNWNKREWFTTTGPITISGNVASWPTRSSSQKAYVTSLLPSGAIVSDAGAYMTNENGSPGTSDWEPYSNLQIDAGTPTSTQFLSVLQWGGSSFTPSATTLLQSTAGQNFDGALIGSSLVMFMRNWPASFTGVTYPASGATTHYVSDLTPNTTYNISGAGAPTSATTDTAGVLTFSASGTGNITIVGSGSSPSPTVQSITVTPASATMQALGGQQYTATCNNSDGSTSNCTSTVTWASSSMGVATINSSGMATGVAQGSASIVATSGSIQGQTTVTVSAPTLQTITLTPGSVTTLVGNTQQFTATGVYSNSTTTDVTNSVNWSSSNTAVMAPNSTGLVSTISQGTATITAASGSVKGTATVTVSMVVTPTFSPAAGTYSTAQTVTITTTTPSATIYYTTNGATPTTSSQVYAGPMTVPATETLKAIAVASSNSTSPVSSATYTITPPTAAPAFSPAAGTYSSAQAVTISTATPSAKIYYTTNGSTPTTSSPVYAGPITISATETLTAIALATGNSASPVSSGAYTITPPTAAPTFSPAAGTYSSAQAVTISTATPSAKIYYTTNGSTPTTSSPVYAGPITVSATETLVAFAVVADNSDNMLIDRSATSVSASSVSSAAYTITPPTAAPTFSPAAGTYSSAQTVTISTATPSAKIYYTTNGSTPTTSSSVYAGPIAISATETLAAIALASGDSASTVNSAAYSIAPPTAAPITAAAAPPTFSPGGGTYASAQTVTISTTTPSAAFYYTTDGSSPTTSSPLYAGPITVSTTETLKAITVIADSADDMLKDRKTTRESASSVSSAAFIIAPPTAAPVFSPAAGTYSSPQTVTISTATPSATIYYTTNGATPTTSSPMYAGPITVAVTKTLKAIAVVADSSSGKRTIDDAASHSTSQVVSAAYVLDPPTPALSAKLTPAR